MPVSSSSGILCRNVLPIHTCKRISSYRFGCRWPFPLIGLPAIHLNCLPWLRQVNGTSTCAFWLNVQHLSLKWSVNIFQIHSTKQHTLFIKYYLYEVKGCSFNEHKKVAWWRKWKAILWLLWMSYSVDFYAYIIFTRCCCQYKWRQKAGWVAFKYCS